MKILLSNHQLTTRSGSELATSELARGLAARGHEVAVFTFFKGAISAELETVHGVPVFDDMDAAGILLFAPDVVHTHHAPCAHYLRLYTSSAVRVHTMLGAHTPLEAPPLDPSIFALGLAISEEVRDRVLTTPFGDSTPIEIFRNWFDDPDASNAPARSWDAAPRVAIITNHVAPDLAAALTALEVKGELHADYFGIEHNSTVVDGRLLSNYDLIISIGRTVLLAAANGIPCIMADIHGTDGLLTPDNLDSVQRVNFSGRHTRTPITIEHIRAELEKARSTDLTELRARVLREFNLDSRIDFLVAQYERLLRERNTRTTPLLDRGDWPAEGLAYAELAARVRHTERLRELERSTLSAQKAVLGAEIETLARMLAAQTARLDEAATEIREHRAALSDAHQAPAPDTGLIDHLQRTLTSRDEAIAWLQTELALAKAAVPRQRSRNLRTVCREAIYTIAHRVPFLRRAVRRLVPTTIKDRLRAVLVGPSQQLPTLSNVAPAPDKRTPTTETNPGCFDVICFANIEWSARFQRPQQLMQQFARAGHRVFYVVASRSPGAGTDYAIERVADNIFQVALKSTRTQDFYAETMASENIESYAAACAALAHDLGVRAAVQIIHLPYWAPLTRRLSQIHGWKTTYDCMDEWDSFPRIGAPLLEEEKRLVAECDLLTVTAGLLYDKWAPQNSNCLLLRNGVDNAVFAAGLSANQLLANVDRPIIGYYGALAEWVDFALIAAIAKAAPSWNFVLIGDHFTDEVDLLKDQPNIHLLGLKPYQDMPRYLYNFDVCIIPFKLNKITHAVDPVKFYEFMAGGKPVVTTPLEELRAFSDYLSFASTPAAFKQAIEGQLGGADAQAVERRKVFALQNDWADRFAAYKVALTALHPLVSIVIVTYGNLDLTRLCVESVLRSTHHPRYEIIIVDNASADGTPEYLRALAAEHEAIQIVLNDTNRGFAAANNQGLAIANGDVLILLNNDTIVPSGWLSGLLWHLANPAIGLLGPVTNSIGNEAKITPDYTDLTGLQPFADSHCREHAGRTFDIPMLAMFCVAMRRDVFEKIGELDENFGVGMFEDDDYSMRVKAAGLRVVCAEDVYIHHFGQAAFKQLVVTGEYDSLWKRNQLYFESKWGAWTPHVHRAQ